MFNKIKQGYTTYSYLLESLQKKEMKLILKQIEIYWGVILNEQSKEINNVMNVDFIESLPSNEIRY